MARAGDTDCKNSKLKKFCDPEPAGGCGVVPFLSANVLFCGPTAAPAQRGGRDLFHGWRRLVYVMWRCSAIFAEKIFIRVA
ncbi:hypothetical protein AGJ02_20865 [Cronobacter sakazakii]|nr:hypothetical protein [Cronobacter sakazakii]EGZ6860869.1 hypothetical protein [Cronobacter sakazakii]EGZ6869065.1 hypothetical protein [Cronobacter sakazakii]EGZ7002160.1 hypothetical protein [Cronobacter sakazakii]EGZ7011299.1 hypothetical protein [Cronobacter sakazakii]